MVQLNYWPPIFTAVMLLATPSLALAEEADPGDEISPISDASQGIASGDGWSLDFGGYIRAGYTWIENDPGLDLYGRNDGFVLHNLRATFSGQTDIGLGFVLSLDAGARMMRVSEDSPVERLATRMADAYISYSPADYLQLNLGQFKAPFDAEELISTSKLLFIHRSVANNGVQGIDGFNVDGLSEDRQIGLQAKGHFFPLASAGAPVSGPGVSYAAAIANGNGANQSLNANEKLAYYGRLNLHWGELARIGGGAFLNDSSFGDPPNQVERQIMGWTADLTLNAYGATVFANIISRQVSTPDLPTNADITSMGYQVQVAYEEPFFGLQPAYRFAYLDPTSDYPDKGNDPFYDNDARTYHTFGLNYNARKYPVRLLTNYTLTMEESAVELANDRLDLLLQVQW